MPMIYVRAKRDRVAFDAPRGGKRISSDDFVAVQHTRYIDRLINIHGDIEVQNQDQKAAPKPSVEKGATRLDKSTAPADK